MSLLFLNCPTTNQALSTSIDANVANLKAKWNSTLRVRCFHCGEVHKFIVREAFLSSAISNEALRAEISG
jgi:hypothetical protein